MRKHVLLYGLLGGVLIAALKFIEYRWLVVEYSVEIYGGLVAAVFSIVGIWLGLRLTPINEFQPICSGMLDNTSGCYEAAMLSKTRPRMKRLFGSLLVALMLDSVSVFAYCPRHPTVRQELLESEFVFVGNVVSENKVNETSEGYFDGINYQISVVEPLRGKSRELISIFSENSSGRFPMLVGQSYLVFTSLTSVAFAGTPVYTISYCGNSGEVAKKVKTLSIVRKSSGARPNLAL